MSEQYPPTDWRVQELEHPAAPTPASNQPTFTPVIRRYAAFFLGIIGAILAVIALPVQELSYYSWLDSSEYGTRCKLRCEWDRVRYWDCFKEFNGDYVMYSKLNSKGTLRAGTLFLSLGLIGAVTFTLFVVRSVKYNVTKTEVVAEYLVSGVCWVLGSIIWAAGNSNCGYGKYAEKNDWLLGASFFMTLIGGIFVLLSGVALVFVWSEEAPTTTTSPPKGIVSTAATAPRTGLSAAQPHAHYSETTAVAAEPGAHADGARVTSSGAVMYASAPSYGVYAGGAAPSAVPSEGVFLGGAHGTAPAPSTSGTTMMVDGVAYISAPAAAPPAYE